MKEWEKELKQGKVNLFMHSLNLLVLVQSSLS